MRHLNAHRKLGRTSEHRMSMLRNLATSLINARDERIKTTVQKAKELRPFVERAITLAKRASTLEGDDTAAQSLHLQRAGALGERDGALDEGAKLLRLLHGRLDALVTRVDERGCEVAQHGHAVLARPPQFSVCV